MANKTVLSVTPVMYLKPTEASFLPNAIDSFCLCIVQVPKSQINMVLC